MRCFLRGFINRFAYRFASRVALILACLIACSLSARAQTGIYAAISSSNFNTPNVGRQYGPTFGLYHDALHLPFVRIGLDARATLLGSDSTEAYSGYVGPHIQLHPHVVPFMPYVEGLVGAGHVNIGEGVATVDKTAFAYEGVIGVDWTLLPHFDWRVIEYSFGSFSGLSASISPRTLSTGVVLRLP